jgi:hypothetical protein
MKKRKWLRDAPCWAEGACSIKQLVATCPLHLMDGKSNYTVEELTVKKSDVIKHFEGYNKLTKEGSWEGVVKRVTDAARKRKCSTLIPINHLNWVQDGEPDMMKTMWDKELVRLSTGGHDHEPYMFASLADDELQRLSIKVGIDGQYLAEINMMFDKESGAFDSIHFDVPKLLP